MIPEIFLADIKLDPIAIDNFQLSVDLLEVLPKGKLRIKDPSGGITKSVRMGKPVLVNYYDETSNSNRTIISYDMRVLSFTKMPELDPAFVDTVEIELVSEWWYLRQKNNGSK